MKEVIPHEQNPFPLADNKVVHTSGIHHHERRDPLADHGDMQLLHEVNRLMAKDMPAWQRNLQISVPQVVPIKPNVHLVLNDSRPGTVIPLSRMLKQALEPCGMLCREPELCMWLAEKAAMAANTLQREVNLCGEVTT